MYCPRCRIEIEGSFCEICGATTVASKEVECNITASQEKISYSIQEEIKKERIKAELPKSTIKKLFSSVAILVIVIGILIGYSFLNNQCTPRRMVQRYYDYLSNEDYDSAYKMLISTDSSFLSNDIYKSSMKQLDFKNYTIKNYNSNDFQDNHDLFNGYQNSNIDNNGNMFSAQVGGELYPISVINVGKKLLFFNDYKIDADSYTVKWQFVAPAGAKISIVGKEPTKSNEPNIDSSFALNDFYKPVSLIYEIGHIFNGSYDVIATMEGAKDIDYKGAVAGRKININFEPTQDIVDQLQNKAKNFLELYYTNASQEKYSDLVTAGSNALKKINQFGFYINNKMVNKVQDVKVTNQSIDDIDHATISVTCKISYEDNSWVSLGGQMQTGIKEVTTDFYFVRQNDKWLIADTGYIN